MRAKVETRMEGQGRDCGRLLRQPWVRLVAAVDAQFVWGNVAEACWGPGHVAPGLISA